MITEKGDVTTSFLLIQRARKSDSGKYSCAPSNANPVTVNVHILNGSYALLLLMMYTHSSPKHPSLSPSLHRGTSCSHAEGRAAAPQSPTGEPLPGPGAPPTGQVAETPMMLRDRRIEGSHLEHFRRNSHHKRLVTREPPGLEE